jgi:hypothetical protein
VWALAPPDRIALLARAGQSIADHLFAPPPLVVAVGLVFAVVVSPGLVEDLETEERDGPTR